MDLATGALRLWNAETQGWYRTAEETEAVQAREAARAKRAEAELARLRAQRKE